MNNYMWLLVVFGLCGGGYYEYTNLQTQAAADRQVLKLEMQGKIDKLQEAAKALDEVNQKLTQAQEESQKQMATLTAQLEASKKAPEPTTRGPGATSGIGGLSSSGATASSSSTTLGTIVTLDGKTFPDSELLKVDASGITIKCSTGITKVGYLVMPPDLQKRFGFDPKTTGVMPNTPIDTQPAAGK